MAVKVIQSHVCSFVGRPWWNDGEILPLQEAIGESLMASYTV